MLKFLKIKNFALIKDQTIEFSNGFNVLVGETGAGKSLIIDAISFVLGAKSNRLNVRTGEDKLFVQAVFEVNNKDVNQFLIDNDIDIDDNLIISRSLNIEGKSDVRINGLIVNVGTLKMLAELLVDIYAQNENIELLNEKNHLSILDSYAGDSICVIKKHIEDKLLELKTIDEQMEELGLNDEIRERKLELLDYEIKEIENADIKIGEDEELKNRIDYLANFEKIYENVKASGQYISKVSDLLSQSESYLSLASKYDNKLLDLVERIKSNRIDICDIQDELDECNYETYDSGELDKLNNRLDVIKSLKKKYGPSIENVLSFLDKCKTEYDNLLFGEEKLKKLAENKNALCDELYNLCLKLSDERKTVSKKIEQDVINELSFLGFKRFSFKVSFTDFPLKENALYTKNGLDNVEFLFSANVGEGLKSLSKTISGGEMSRFMLAIKNVFAKFYNSSTLVFDEVDTGISGEIGQKVAERLAMLSKSFQLICISHLCQVTAMADKYIFVSKDVSDGKTYTTTKYLNNQEVLSFIAEISGAEPTDVALQFAKQLKDKANMFKKEIE